MRDDRDGEPWDSCPDDPFDALDREEWDEDDWEEFLSRQDVLTAKYQELFETLGDHPKRDEIIAREMHWNLPEGAVGRGGRESAPDGQTAQDDSLGSVSAYRMAQEYALAFDRLVTARLRDRAVLDEDACSAMQAAIAVPAAIAGGHGIGYERDSLCGNIACCKRALASLEGSLDGLLALRKRGALLPGEADVLLREGRGLAAAIQQRVEDLRHQVWWH